MNKTAFGARTLAIVLSLAALGGCAATTTTSDTSGSGGGDAAASNPNYTPSQANAIRSAKQYLSTSPFSKKGLIEQLSSDAGEGFPKADAKFAVNHIEVNWKEQAVKSAKQYLDMSGFSRAGLIEQLSSSAGEKYTRKQAEYGADQVGLK